MALPEAMGRPIQMLSDHQWAVTAGDRAGSPASRSSLVVFLEVFLITLTP